MIVMLDVDWNGGSMRVLVCDDERPIIRVAREIRSRRMVRACGGLIREERSSIASRL